MGTNGKEQIDDIKDYLNDLYNPNFRFDVEHWEWGNVDDSYSYGIESGEQYLVRELLQLLDGDHQTHIEEEDYVR